MVGATGEAGVPRPDGDRRALGNAGARCSPTRPPAPPSAAAARARAQQRYDAVRQTRELVDLLTR